MSKFSRFTMVLLAALSTNLAVASDKPVYTTRSPEILGSYSDAAQNYTLLLKRNARGKLEIEDDFGGTDHKIFAKNGVILFTTGELDVSGEGCDDVGCWNLMKLSGVIYPSKAGEEWLPAIKLTVKREYPYPEYEGDNEGEVTEVIRLLLKKGE
jgi:hypothetical protein